MSSRRGGGASMAQTSFALPGETETEWLSGPPPARTSSMAPQAIEGPSRLAPPGSGPPSEDPEDWGDLVWDHPRLGAWHDLVLAPEVARSCVGDGSSCLHPRYETLPRLRSREPDLDLLRRLGVNRVFEPSPGQVFLAVRLKDLPLRALAAVCQHRLGSSTLAGLFTRGDDPGEYAAAALAGLAQPRREEYERWLR